MSDIAIKPQLLKNYAGKVYLFRNTYYENPLYRAVYTLVASSEGEEASKGFVVSFVDLLKKTSTGIEGDLVNIEKVAEFDATIFLWIFLLNDAAALNPETDVAKHTVDKVVFLKLFGGESGTYKAFSRSSAQRLFEYIFFGFLANIYNALRTMTFSLVSFSGFRRAITPKIGINQVGVFPLMASLLPLPMGVRPSPINREMMSSSLFREMLDTQSLFKVSGRLPYALFPVGLKNDSDLNHSSVFAVDTDISLIHAALEREGIKDDSPWEHMTCTDVFSVDTESLQFEAAEELRAKIRDKQAAQDEEAMKAEAQRIALEKEKELHEIKATAQMKVVSAVDDLEAKRLNRIKEAAEIAAKERQEGNKTFESQVDLLKKKMQELRGKS